MFCYLLIARSHRQHTFDTLALFITSVMSSSFLQNHHQKHLQPAVWQHIPYVPQPHVLHSQTQQVCRHLHVVSGEPAELPADTHLLPAPLRPAAWEQVHHLMRQQPQRKITSVCNCPCGAVQIPAAGCFRRIAECRLLWVFWTIHLCIVSGPQGSRLDCDRTS